MTHVCPFGAGDVASAVAARVSQGAARALKLGRVRAAIRSTDEHLTAEKKKQQVPGS